MPESEDELVVVTVKLPKRMLYELNELVRKKVFVTKSEAIREGIRMLLEKFSK